MNIVTNALKSDHYFRSTVILFIDIIVSVLATMCMLAFIRFLGVGAAEDSRFLTTWILGSFGASLIAFMATKSHLIVIRHTTIREFVRLVEAVCGKELLLCVAVCLFVFGLASAGVIFSMLVLDFFITLAGLVLVRVMMLVVYDFL